MSRCTNISRFKIVLFSGCTSVFILFVYFGNGSQMLKDLNFSAIQFRRPPPVVLLYNTWSGETLRRQPWRNVSEDLWELPSCPAHCLYTMDRDNFGPTADLLFATTSGLVDFGEVVAGLRQLIDDDNNTSDQVWVWGSLEPAQYSWRINDRVVESHFHWTAAYRTDSDIPWPYGEIVSVSPREPRHPPGDFKKKKMAAWLVSRCDADSGRQELVKTLQQYFPIDVYGHCGASCPGGNLPCRDFLTENYKFYLSFENTYCYEYTTEKFFFALGRMVPVTAGWTNYSRFAPPHSHINALDFGSVRELAEYLLYLGEREEEYLKYFEWTRNFDVNNDTLAVGLCRACEKFLSHFAGPDVPPPGRHPSPNEWFYNLPRNPDGSAGNRTLRVGDANITVDHVCITYKENSILSSWIKGGIEGTTPAA